MAEEEREFPLKEVASLSPCIEGAAVARVSGRPWLVNSYLDILQIIDQNSGKVLKTIGKLNVGLFGNGENSQRRIRRSMLDEGGFSSISYDDIIDVDVGKEDECSFEVAQLHRSGHVRTWRVQTDGEIEITKISSYKCGLRNPRIIQCHPALPYVAIASMEGGVKVFSADSTARCCDSFQKIWGHGDMVSSMRFHPRRALLALGSHRGEVVITDLIRSTVILSIHAHEAAVTDVCFIDILVDGQQVPHFVTGSTDKWIKVWNFTAVIDNLKSCLEESYGSSQGFARSVLPGLSAIQWGEELTESEKSALNSISAIRSSKKRRLVDRAVDVENSLSSLRDLIAANQNIITSGSSILKLRTRDEIQSMCILTKAMANYAKFQVTSSWVVVTAGGTNGNLRVWDLQAKAEVIECVKPHRENSLFDFPKPPINKLLRSKDGQTIIVVGRDKSLVFWTTTPNLQCTHSIKGASGVSSYHRVCRTPSSSCGIHIYCTSATGGLQRMTLPLKSTGDSDGAESGVIIEEMQDDQVMGDASSDTVEVTCLDVTPDGKYLAYGRSDGSASVFHLKEDGEEQLFSIPAGLLNRAVIHIRFIYSKGFTDGCPSTMVTIGSDNYIRLWKLKRSSKSDETKVLSSSRSMKKASAKHVYCIALSPNGRFLATDDEKRLVIWDSSDLSQLSSSSSDQSHKRVITALCFSNMEQIVVSASADQTLKLWNLKTMELISSLTGFESSITTLNYHPDGIRLIGGESDGRIHIWDTKRAIHIGSSHNHFAPISFFSPLNTDNTAVLPDGNDTTEQLSSDGALNLVSCAEDGSVLFWLDRTEQIAQEELEKARKMKNEAAEVNVLLTESKFRKAFKRALKLRRFDLFEATANAISRRIEQNLFKADGEVKDKIELLFGSLAKKHSETLLMAATQFFKSAKTLHLGQWILSIVLSQPR